MKGIFWIVLSAALVICATALSFSCFGPTPQLQSVRTTTSSISANQYQDACVTNVVHPELRVELFKTEKQGPDCSICQYWFRIWNQTSAIGTKAYKTQILISRSSEPEIVLNGKVIQRLKLDGFITELKPIQYGVIRDQEYFVVEAQCVDCLSPSQAEITLIVEYYECSGIRRFQLSCDLRAKAVSVVNQSFESVAGGCK